MAHPTAVRWKGCAPILQESQGETKGPFTESRLRALVWSLRHVSVIWLFGANLLFLSPGLSGVPSSASHRSEVLAPARLRTLKFWQQPDVSRSKRWAGVASRHRPDGEA